jgi:hypothetical protein
MKKAIKNVNYLVISGNDCITGGNTIKEICNKMGVSFSYVYKYKHKNINGDGSWSFNYKGFNFTIYTTLEYEFLVTEEQKEQIKINWNTDKKLPKLLSGELEK